MRGVNNVQGGCLFFSCRTALLGINDRSSLVILETYACELCESASFFETCEKLCPAQWDVLHTEWAADAYPKCMDCTPEGRAAMRLRCCIVVSFIRLVC
jgi:hypothetical protein